jgi:predicted ATP-dependent serine protease
MQSIINYLQSVANEDDALLVKKQWTCISCDKNLEKYAGKIGQHLNWESLSSKKISPSRIGAFGQTGQLATKIKNLM